MVESTPGQKAPSPEAALQRRKVSGIALTGTSSAAGAEANVSAAAMGGL